MSDAKPVPKAYRLKQAAELLSLPYSTLYDLVRRGEIASVQLGTGARKVILIPSSAIDELLSGAGSETRRRARG